MKKRNMLLTGVLAAGILSLSVYAAEAGEILGTWYLVSMESDGTAINPETFGMDMELELSEDGTAFLAMEVDEEEEEKQVQTGSWKLQDSSLLLDIQDLPSTFSYEDGVLTGEADGNILIFGREPEESELIEASPVIESPALEDYNGHWTASMIEVGDMQFPAALVEIQMSLDITDGTVSISYHDDMEAVEAEISGNLEGDTLMVSNPEVNEEAVYLYFDPNQMNLRLHESGVMSYSNKSFEGEESGEEYFTVYFVK